MRPKSKTDLAAVQRSLRDLDLRDKCVVLAMSIIETNNVGLGPIFGFLNCISHMARQMSVEQRFDVAEILRNTADQIECQVREERCQT